MKCVQTLFCLSFMLSSTMAADRLSGKTFTTRSEVMAKHGMACTSHPLATQIAIETLKQGGSAVDAAIAANARARIIGTSEQRNRWRFVCHRMGRQNREVVRIECEWPLAQVTHT